MICPRCGSENINVQMVTYSKLKNKHRSIILVTYWMVATYFVMVFSNYTNDISKIIWT